MHVSSGWPPTYLTQHPYHLRLAGLLATQFAVASWLRFVAHRVPAGAPRLLVCLWPILVLLAAPTIFNYDSEIIMRTSVIFCCAWLGSFKVLALCLNRGPLARPLSILQTYALLYFPIFPTAGETPGAPKGRLHDKSGTPIRLLLQFFAKMVVLGLVVYLILNMELQRNVKHFVYAFGLVGFLGLLMDGPASLATSLIGLNIIPTFDQPWLSSSLADFWGRRWNITTSSILRTLVYDPIVEGVLIKKAAPQAAREGLVNGAKQAAAGEQQSPAVSRGSSSHMDGVVADGEQAPAAAASKPPATRRIAKWRRVAGTCATFLVSGLSHEFVLWMILPALPNGSRPWLWKWTAYFTVQAPLLLAEMSLKKAWRRAGLPELNVWVARAITLSFLLLVADPLFFAPVDRDSYIADLNIKRVSEGFVWVGSTVRPLLSWLAAHLPTPVWVGDFLLSSEL